MKNFTKSTLLAVVFANCFLSVNAQTERQTMQMKRNYDSDKLKDLQVQSAINYEKNHAKAIEIAMKTNRPLTYKTQDGRMCELHGVDDFGNLMYYATTNAGSAITSRANTLYKDGGLGLDINGTGMLAFVWDQFLALPTHLDLKNRVFNFDKSNVGYGVGQSDGDHGTHVTGTIISSGASSAGLQGRGIAYGAKVYNSDWTNDLSEMASAAADYGMLVSNHSYGLVATAAPETLPVFGKYISSTMALDDFMFNAPYSQPVIAAGNDRDNGFNPDKGGYDLLTEWAVSKNAIVVAAVNGVPSYTGADSVIMSVFSSYGPTDDNRIKPDISDKGVNVYSTSNTSNTAYAYKDGTSMATPGVTATLLLLQQYFSEVYPDNEIVGSNTAPFMKAATLRGLMCHTADEAGSFAGPDSRFGWGLINAQRAAQTITKSAIGQSVLAELSLAQGQVYTKNISVSGSEPLMATISWTDRGGVPASIAVDESTPVLVNDLDIRVTKAGGTTYLPWKLDSIANGYNTAAVKGDNSVDNIEKIEIENPSGDYTITVRHKGVLVGGSQDYSLIITGADINLRTNENAFKVFDVWPNPAKDVLNISLQSESGEDTYVTLYDMLGKRILDQKLEANGDILGGKLDVGSLNQGMYLVKVDQGNKQTTKKVLINR